VFIARALAKDPELLILDEPESHLDYKNQLLVLRMLARLVRERGMSCIINTHYPDHALRMADQTLIQGRSGTGEPLYIHGKTEDIITESNIQRFFDVEARIISIDRTPREPLRTLVVTE
jgi:iron complex transport system ATP-binding protein